MPSERQQAAQGEPEFGQANTLATKLPSILEGIKRLRSVAPTALLLNRLFQMMEPIDFDFMKGL